MGPRFFTLIAIGNSGDSGCRESSSDRKKHAYNRPRCTTMKTSQYRALNHATMNILGVSAEGHHGRDEAGKQSKARSHSRSQKCQPADDFPIL